ncbi:GNAT family N-acetyltransferase [Undibacterium sp. TS12]|uniref:GNAT family N-acetyltransferase n=1 Tax=Undibacterium sp. TS12 TaxID=2908202 RepID=UPI001F4CC23F|nr:GNAT family N-acetyltransferase [Undibacterium sp. TS12]MCH8623000.1 GNAT family N-acetyltransferase [Undibacterium sp. TS12]
MLIRLAQASELDALVQMRMRLFGDLVDFNQGKGANEQLLAATRDYYARAFDNHECKTWVAEADGKIVATGSLVVFVRPPYPGNTSGKDAYLLNMYTMAEYRKQGLARKILQQAMQYAREQGYGKVWLQATDDGQPLYASAGFASTSDYMEWEVSQSGA